MKKLIFSGIMMLAAACMMTSCGPETPEPVKLGNSGLTAYAVLQDKAKETFAWNVENETGQKLYDYIFVAPPAAFEEFFLGEKQDGQIVFNSEGASVIEGKDCVFETIQDTRCISYNIDGVSFLYLTEKKVSLAKKDQMLFQADRYFYLNGEFIGVQNYDGQDILPAPQKEIICLTVNKKVKKATQTSNYYAAKDDKGWNLYGADGKLIKKLAKWQVQKYQKGATKDAVLDKLSYNTLTSL